MSVPSQAHLPRIQPNQDHDQKIILEVGVSQGEGGGGGGGGETFLQTQYCSFQLVFLLDIWI